MRWERLRWGCSAPARKRNATATAAGDAVLARDGVPEAQRSLDLAADMRYRGQAYELLIPWTDGVDEAGLADAIAAAEFRDRPPDRPAPSARAPIGCRSPLWSTGPRALD